MVIKKKKGHSAVRTRHTFKKLIRSERIRQAQGGGGRNIGEKPGGAGSTPVGREDDRGAKKKNWLAQ